MPAAQPPKVDSSRQLSFHPNYPLLNLRQVHVYDEAGNIVEMEDRTSFGSSWTRRNKVATANNQIEATTIPGDGAA